MFSDHTFADTGIKIKIRKISPMLAADIMAGIPEPVPPLNEVDYGEPKGKVKEPNFSDPAYEAELALYRLKLNDTWRRAIILRGVVVEGDEWRKSVKEYRDFIQTITGKPLAEQDDLMVYIFRVCMGSEEDMEELIQAITRRSQPTQEAVEQAKNSFRSSI